MRVNIENTINHAAELIEGDQKKYYQFSLHQIIEHLKIVRKQYDDGNSKEVLDEFFKFYCFNDDQDGVSKISFTCKIMAPPDLVKPLYINNQKIIDSIYCKICDSKLNYRYGTCPICGYEYCPF